MPKTMFEKIWETHEVRGPEQEGGPSLLYIDLHLVHEVTSAQAFEGLRLAGRKVRRPDRTLATADHNVPTDPRERTSLDAIADHLSREQVAALERNCAEFGVPALRHAQPPPGHRARDRAGARALAAGHHDRLRRLAHLHARRARRAGDGRSAPPRSSTCWRRSACCRRGRSTMRITYEGEPGFGVTAKDLILGTIGQISAAGAVGHAIEYAGAPIEALSIEGRMTICNMSIEAGARAGMIAPDDVDLLLPGGTPRRRRRTSTPPSSAGARCRPTPARRFDTEVTVDTAALSPAGHLGHEPRAGRARHRPGPGSRPSWTVRPTASRPSARSPTWRSSPARRSRTSRSTACSSAPARTRASRTCAWRPRWCAAGRSRRPCDAMVVPGLAAGEGAGRAGGPRRGLPSRRVRVARGRLLDVPRDEPGHPPARRALRLDVEPQLRGPPGPRRAHAPRQPPDGRGRGRSRATSSTSGSGTARRCGARHERPGAAWQQAGRSRRLHRATAGSLIPLIDGQEELVAAPDHARRAPGDAASSTSARATARFAELVMEAHPGVDRRAGRLLRADDGGRAKQRLAAHAGPLGVRARRPLGHRRGATALPAGDRYDAVVSAPLHPPPARRAQARALRARRYDLLEPGGIFLNWEHVGRSGLGDGMFEECMLERLLAAERERERPAARRGGACASTSTTRPTTTSWPTRRRSAAGCARSGSSTSTCSSRCRSWRSSAA